MTNGREKENTNRGFSSKTEPIQQMRSEDKIQNIWTREQVQTRLGVDKVKPKGWVWGCGDFGFWVLGLDNSICSFYEQRKFKSGFEF